MIMTIMASSRKIVVGEAEDEEGGQEEIQTPNAQGQELQPSWLSEFHTAH